MDGWSRSALAVDLQIFWWRGLDFKASELQRALVLYLSYIGGADLALL